MAQLEKFIMPNGDVVELGGSGGSEEWIYLFNDTLTEDTAYLTFDNFKFKELEAYVVVTTPFSNEGTLYLTSSATGSIYGDPRISQLGVKNTFTGVVYLKFEVINNDLWKGYKSIPPYLGMGNYENLSTSFCHKVAGTIINKEYIEGMTLIQAQASLPSGTKIIIRGR